MEIRNSKFKVGDKVTTLSKVGEVLGTISGIKYYDLQEGTYIYKVKFDRDGFTEESYLDQFVLDAYIEKPKSVWDLKEGDTYYSIYGNGNVSSEKKWFDDDYENNYREIGNTFLTKEEAEFEVERRRIETKMIKLGGRRKFELGKANWYLEYRPSSGGIEILWSSYEIDQGVIYFDSEEKAKKVVEIIGKGIIEKYIFGVDK